MQSGHDKEEMASALVAAVFHALAKTIVELECRKSGATTGAAFVLIDDLETTLEAQSKLFANHPA